MSREENKKTMTKQQKMSAKKKQRKKRMILIAVEILILLILLVVVFAVKKLSFIEKEEVPIDNIEINEGISEESHAIMEEFTTIALFGLDNRSNGNLASGRSDVIMIATINNSTQEVKISSVYRDTYLDTGSGKFQKCNAAYSKGGPEQAINMLNKNLDLAITDYVTVDFNAVVECIDLLGGVEVEITEDEAIWMIGHINETAKLTGKEANQLSGAGTYTLDGVQACAYARVRQTAGSDFKRVERQQLVIQKMVEKAKKSDLSTLNKIINTVFSDIQTSFSNAELIALASQVFNYKLGEMRGFPYEKNTITLGSKGNVVVPCDLESNVIELHQFLYNDMDYVPSDTVVANSKLIVNESGLSTGDGY